MLAPGSVVLHGLDAPLWLDLNIESILDLCRAIEGD